MIDISRNWLNKVKFIHILNQSLHFINTHVINLTTLTDIIHFIHFKVERINEQWISKKYFLGGLVLTSIAFGSFKANTADFHQNAAHDGKVVSPIKLHDILEKTQPNQVARNFGKPNEIMMMKNTMGEVTGVMWVVSRCGIKFTRHDGCMLNDYQWSDEIRHTSRCRLIMI